MEPREKIFEAALEEFAANGYNKTTIRDICTRAGVNVAAVNYYFSGKAELYSKIFEYLFSREQCNEINPFEPASSVTEAKERLRQWIFGFMHRNRDCRTSLLRHRVMVHEMFEPSELYDELMVKYIKPELFIMLGWLKMCLPPDYSDDQIAIICFSLVSKCIFYFDHRNFVRVMMGDDFIPRNLDAIAEMVTEETFRHFV